MAMVEKGLGLAVLPGLILKQMPYHLVFKPLKPRAYRDLVFATKSGYKPSLTVRRFREFLS